MSWIILLITSFISTAIILYAFWPKHTDQKSRKIAVIIIAVTAFILPTGLNYFFDKSTKKDAIKATDFSAGAPEMKKSIWAGGTTQMQFSDTKDISMEAVTARLEEKLKKNPNDIDGWILLGRSYAALGSPDKAFDLFQEKVIQYPNNINLLVSYGETLTQNNNGIITDEAKGLFLKAHSMNNAHPRVEYNLAQYDIQHGQYKQAYDRLKALLDTAPEKAPWIAQVTKSMALATEKINGL